MSRTKHTSRCSHYLQNRKISQNPNPNTKHALVVRLAVALCNLRSAPLQALAVATYHHLEILILIYRTTSSRLYRTFDRIAGDLT